MTKNKIHIGILYEYTFSATDDIVDLGSFCTVDVRAQNELGWGPWRAEVPGKPPTTHLTKCPVGHIPVENRRCEKCRAGTFAQEQKCKTCPDGEIAKADRSACRVCTGKNEVAREQQCVCDVAFYRDEDNTCQSCPEGATCVPEKPIRNP